MKFKIQVVECRANGAVYRNHRLAIPGDFGIFNDTEHSATCDQFSEGKSSLCFLTVGTDGSYETQNTGD